MAKPTEEEVAALRHDGPRAIRTLFQLTADGFATGAMMARASIAQSEKQQRWIEAGMSSKRRPETIAQATKVEGAIMRRFQLALQEAQVTAPPSRKDRASISGRVVLEGRGIEGVVVSAVDPKGVQLASARTDAAGTYTLDIEADAEGQELRLIAAEPGGLQVYADRGPRVVMGGKAVFAALTASATKRGYTPRPPEDRSAPVMPELVGLSLPDAVAALEKAHIPIAGAEFVKVRSGTGGDVRKSIPKAGEPVPEGIRVKLEVGASEKLQFRRPLVAGLLAANSGGAAMLGDMEKMLERVAKKGASGLDGLARLAEQDSGRFAKSTGLSDNAEVVQAELSRLSERFRDFGSR